MIAWIPDKVHRATLTYTLFSPVDKSSVLLISSIVDSFFINRPCLPFKRVLVAPVFDLLIDFNRASILEQSGHSLPIALWNLTCFDVDDVIFHLFAILYLT